MLNEGEQPTFRILFVDDEEKICKYFQRLFSDDFSIITAGDGAQALDILARDSDRIAVLLTDQRMPIRDGVSLLKEVRQRHPHVIRLLTTAFANLEDAIDAVNSGEVRRYITKPWDVDALRHELRQALETFFTQQYERDLIQGKRRTMLSLASYIAHEMRTPLLSISAASKGINRYLPTLLDAHDQAREHGLPVAPMRANHRRTLETATGNVQRLVNRANAIIDILLINAGGRPVDHRHFAPHSMIECIRTVLAEYPFTDGERDQVRLRDSPDFVFHGPDTLMVYVLYNLLKNALYAIAAADGGEISIWLQPGETEHRLYVRDTGTGIPAAALPHIFDEFTSFRPPGAGTGLGLAFCKRALTSLGGDIRCASDEGVYTQLTVSLPATPPGGLT